MQISYISLIALFAFAITILSNQQLAKSSDLPDTHPTTFNEKNNITRKDPNYPFDGEFFTGFIVVDNTTQSNLFYQLYAYNQTTFSTSAPLILWLQGGPGCASSYGNYVENGPVKVYNGSTPSSYVFTENHNTWNKHGHMLYIDSPTGTGFSRANGFNVSTTEQAAKHLTIFLARFYQIYPEFVNYPLYITSESYGGKYVPQLSYDLLMNDTFTKDITLAGIAIGDGWGDPINQLATFGSIGYAAGLIDAKSRDQLRLEEVQAVNEVKKGDYWDATNLSNDLVIRLIELAGNISAYEYRDFSNSDSESMASDAYANWYNTSEAQAFLEVPYEVYVECQDYISDVNMQSDNTKSFAYLYPELISRIPVLIYTGQDDENVNYEGEVRFLNHLNWTDIDKFRHANRVPWKLTNGTTAGLVKTYDNLTFLLVFKAGHMLPAYQPAVSSEMIYNFINRIPFD